ncbi:hypothetical protein Tco_1059746 [Tanacetum coccineum]
MRSPTEDKSYDELLPDEILQLPLNSSADEYLQSRVSLAEEFLIKMSPRRNMNINDVYEQEFEQRIMERIEERLDQFVDQLADRMNDMMNPKRRGDHDE